MRINIFKQIRSSLTKKLVLSYLLVVFIPITLSGIIFLRYNQGIIKDKYMNLVDNQIMQLDVNISEKINLCSQNISLITLDKNITDMLQNDDFTAYYLINTIVNEAIPRIDMVKLQNKYVYKLKIIHGNPGVYDVENYFNFRKSFQDGNWDTAPEIIQKGKKLKYGEVYIEPSHLEKLSSGSISKKKVYSLYSPVFNIIKDNIIGIVQLDILEEVILQPIKQLKFTGSEIINVVNSQGSIIYSNNTVASSISFELNQESKRIENVTVDNQKMLMDITYLKRLDCWLVVYIPDQDIPSVGDYKGLIISLLVAGLITLGIIAYFISKLLLSNLRKLLGAINKVRSGDMETFVSIKSGDEVEVIADNFNDMITRINSLMTNIEKSNIAEKEAIYKSLENQMNPHFLCNAMDAVRMTAEIHNETDICKAIELIISYLMYSIKIKNKYVKIDEEISNVIKYISIYNLIKNNGIKYSISVSNDISDKLDSFTIIKFILQPIVENSIKHGFKNKKEDCQLYIRVNKVGEDIIIEVEDNGKGMSRERVEKLSCYLDMKNGSAEIETCGCGIGLRNINERLEMNFGSNYLLTVDSSLGVGTSITIKIPAMDYEKPILK